MKNIFLLFFLNCIAISIQAQCISGDCQNGKGTYVYPSGAKYVGDFVDGEIHGIGVCFYTDGSKYSGQWTHRYPEGKGTKTYADGTKRAGNWLKGQPINEKGDLVEEYLVAKGEEANDGTDIQTGCISGDCKNGAGVFAYADGSKYEGLFENGKLNGDGAWFFPNGDKYVGSFKNNFTHGDGIVFHADGSETSGAWVKGEYVGDIKGEVKQGCIQGDCGNGRGTFVYQNAEAKYIGSFSGNLPNGRGTCYYANGERYEGEWESGSFNGYGTLYLKDGSEATGYWKDGTFLGAAVADAKEEVVMEETIEVEVQREKPKVQEEALPNVKVWAVIIGVASYSHMPVLRYTDDDAYRMYAFLKSPEGGALSDEQIRILIDEDATKDKIKKTMTDLFMKAGPNDLVVLYFSGHGLKGSFLPIDFDGFNNKLFHEEINDLFNLSPAKYKLCIADACHSGSLFAMKSGTAESTLNTYYKTLAQATAGTALIMSSKSDETSLESSGLRQGVFSHFLIRGLKGEADIDENQIVSVQELYNYIAENVRSYTGNRQSPVIKGDYDQKMTVGVRR